MTPDRELLQHYATTNSEDAFAELVRRHVNLVYSAALRQVNGDAHLAHDVAQTVFTDLARKAGSLARHDSLTGWLYTSAHFAAAKIVRGETRRRDREEKFMREPINENAPDTDWEKLRPVLDDAMHELKATDREAVLLRYFENRQFAEVGAKLGLNENAARMRVERAVEKLRGILTKRGLATTTALATAISAHAIETAPAGLAATLTATSLASATVGTLTLTKIITTMKLKLIFSALVVASAATALVVQHQTQTKLRGENQTLQQQIVQLKADNASFSNQLANVGDSKKLLDDQFNELLKLRGEIGVLRRQLGELKNLQKTNNQSHMASTPDQQKQLEHIQQENQKINQARIWCAAIQQYTLSHNGVSPNSFEELKPFVPQYDSLIDSNKFEIVSEGNISESSYPEVIIVLREKDASQIANGKLWQKYYGFADGNVKPIISQNGSFDKYEKKHMASTSLNQ